MRNHFTRMYKDKTSNIIETVYHAKDYIKKDDIVYDLGSGAGFPGLMLSYGGIKNVNLIESNSKKASFLTVAAAFSPNKVNIHNKNICNENECTRYAYPGTRYPCPGTPVGTYPGALYRVPVPGYAYQYRYRYPGSKI